MPGGGGTLPRLDVEEGQQAGIEVAPVLACAQGGVALGGHGIATQLRQHGLGRALAHVHGLRRALELHRRQVAKVRAQEGVAGSERGQGAFGLLQHQHADHLVEHRAGVAELRLRQQGRAHVHHHHRHAPDRPQLVHRHVVGDAAIHQQPLADAHRRERARHRHAGADRDREVAIGEHHLLAADDVGGDRAERDRQRIEIRVAPGRQGQPAQQQHQLLPAHQAGGDAHPAIAVADLQLQQVAEILVLAIHRQFAAWRVVDEHVRPVDVLDQVLQLGGVVARGVQAADNRTHAGAADRADRDAFALQHLEHADVGDAARATAAQHQADAAGVRRLDRACRLRRHHSRPHAGHQGARSQPSHPPASHLRNRSLHRRASPLAIAPDRRSRHGIESTGGHAGDTRMRYRAIGHDCVAFAARPQ